MAVNNDDLRKAMDTLGISDIHVNREEAKKIYKKLLIKWHPDSCSNGDERFYNDICTRINAAYDIIEKAYDEGLMGPNAKTENHNNINSDIQSPVQRTQTYTTTNDKNQDHDTSADYFDAPSGWDIVYFRKRWLNIFFLTICLIYIINAILKSPSTDIYIEKSVINLISMTAVFYGVYWFCKALLAECGFLFSGIIAGLIYKGTTFISMFIYNKFGAEHEWLAMSLFIAVFFIVEYCIHIKKILLTFNRKIRTSKYTTFFSCFMLFEYATMLVFGIYSVALVHKYIAIRNTIIPPWYY